jgi:hypothetical protein
MCRQLTSSSPEWSTNRASACSRLCHRRAASNKSAWYRYSGRQLVLTLAPLQRLVKAPAAASTRRRPVVAKRDWAHVVDVNREIVNFHELVPDMAREVRALLYGAT